MVVLFFCIHWLSVPKNDLRINPIRVLTQQLSRSLKRVPSFDRSLGFEGYGIAATLSRLEPQRPSQFFRQLGSSEWLFQDTVLGPSPHSTGLGISGDE